MKISARNVLSCKVKKVTTGAVNDEIIVELPGGEEIVSIITKASAERLGLTLGKKVTVYLEEHRTRGKYGRLLAYVQLPDRRFLNEVLLIEGFAYADLRFGHSFYNRYKQLEAAARSQKKGLWAGVTPEQLPEWLQKRSF